MGLFDKAKEAGDDLKDKAGEVLDKVEGKVEELAEKEGIVGKVAGVADKAIDKIQGEGGGEEEE